MHFSFFFLRHFVGSLDHQVPDLYNKNRYILLFRCKGDLKKKKKFSYVGIVNIVVENFHLPITKFSFLKPDVRAIVTVKFLIVA